MRCLCAYHDINDMSSLLVTRAEMCTNVIRMPELDILCSSQGSTYKGVHHTLVCMAVQEHVRGAVRPYDLNAWAIGHGARRLRLR